jgi:hypothetical protein
MLIFREDPGTYGGETVASVIIVLHRMPLEAEAKLIMKAAEPDLWAEYVDRHGGLPYPSKRYVAGIRDPSLDLREVCDDQEIRTVEAIVAKARPGTVALAFVLREHVGDVN